MRVHTPSLLLHYICTSAELFLYICPAEVLDHGYGRSKWLCPGHTLYGWNLMGWTSVIFMYDIVSPSFV
jgi:hypothetical protein